jgi:hypothetical protein
MTHQSLSFPTYLSSPKNWVLQQDTCFWLARVFGARMGYSQGMTDSAERRRYHHQRRSPFMGRSDISSLFPMLWGNNWSHLAQFVDWRGCPWVDLARMCTPSTMTSLVVAPLGHDKEAPDPDYPYARGESLMLGNAQLLVSYHQKPTMGSPFSVLHFSWSGIAFGSGSDPSLAQLYFAAKAGVVLAVMEDTYDFLGGAFYGEDPDALKTLLMGLLRMGLRAPFQEEAPQQFLGVDISAHEWAVSYRESQDIAAELRGWKANQYAVKGPAYHGFLPGYE